MTRTIVALILEDNTVIDYNSPDLMQEIVDLYYNCKYPIYHDTQQVKAIVFKKKEFTFVDTAEGITIRKILTTHSPHINAYQPFYIEVLNPLPKAQIDGSR